MHAWSGAGMGGPADGGEDTPVFYSVFTILTAYVGSNLLGQLAEGY